MGDTVMTTPTSSQAVVQLPADFASLVKNLRNQCSSVGANFHDIASRSISLLELIANSKDHQEEILNLRVDLAASRSDNAEFSSVIEDQENIIKHLQGQLDKERRAKAQKVAELNSGRQDNIGIDSDSAGNITTAGLTSIQSNTNVSASIKIPDPERFTGDREKLRSFLVQLRLKTYPLQDDKQAQLRYAVSVLGGDALNQIIPFMRDDKIDLPDLKALIDILERAFGDPDRAATAARKLYALKQGHREFSTYYAEFARYAADVDWNEPAKLSVLKNGLSYDLKQDLIPLPEEPQTIEALVAVCQKLDNRRRALENSKKYSSFARTSTSTRTFATSTPPPSRPYIPPTTTTSSTPSTATGTHPGPMDLSTATTTNKKRISNEERAKRLAEGRCFYCGGLGHISRECPQKRSIKVNEAQLGDVVAEEPKN
jgi:hypothetical protein